MQQWPNFLRTGYYDRSSGHIVVRTSYGDWWSAMVGSMAFGYYLVSHPSATDSRANYYRGNGFAVRCVVREG